MKVRSGEIRKKRDEAFYSGGRSSKEKGLGASGWSLVTNFSAKWRWEQIDFIPIARPWRIEAFLYDWLEHFSDFLGCLEDWKVGLDVQQMIKYCETPLNESKTFMLEFCQICAIRPETYDKLIWICTLLVVGVLNFSRIFCLSFQLRISWLKQLFRWPYICDELIWRLEYKMSSSAAKVFFYSVMPFSQLFINHGH